MSKQHDYKKILVVQLRQLGDILLTTPVCEALKKKYPEAHISFLSHPMGKLVLDNNPYIDEILYYPLKNKDYPSFLYKLRSAEFDLVFDFMFNFRSAFFSRITGAKKRVSFESRRGFFFTDLVARNAKEKMYIAQDKFRLLEQVGIYEKAPNLTLTWSEKDLEKTKAFLNQFDQKDIRVIMSPTHRREKRKWNLKKYAMVSDFLAQRWGAKVIWLWGPGEEECIDEVMNLTNEVSYKAPSTGFREMAALVGQADLFIANSNGPSHVAVSCNTPSIQLHGPTHDVSWCPLNMYHQSVNGGSFPSSMENISISSVISKLDGMEEVIHTAKASRQELKFFRNYKESVERFSRN